MSPRFWPNQFYKILLGTVLNGLCLFSYAQTGPLEIPPSLEYPGIIQTFEKLIQVDATKINNKTKNLTKNAKRLPKNANVENLELDPDFLNSIILHSDAGYVRLASTSKCSFYSTIITNLLSSNGGMIKDIIVSYLNDQGTREEAMINRDELYDLLIVRDCPLIRSIIGKFQIKNLEETLKSIDFSIPASADHCKAVHTEWLSNAVTPYLCQIHEYISSETPTDSKGSPIKKEFISLIEKKLDPTQKDYLENLCEHLDDENMFCEEFTKVSFWNKVARGLAKKIYAEDICTAVTGNNALSGPGLKQCLSRLRKDNALCLYPAGISQGLLPQPECDLLSVALNYSNFRSDYRDCPANSDQMAVTNFSRLLLSMSQEEIKPFAGNCTAISSGVMMEFNHRFNNDENWKLEACYQNEAKAREICLKTYFGEYDKQPQAYPNVVASILRETRGADATQKCAMVDSELYNPLLLEYKSGCHIIYERDKCFMSQCQHFILYNDRPITFIKIKNRMTMDYFPTNVKDERYSQNYLLTHDFKKQTRSLNNLTSIMSYFKKNKGVIHGIGCAEDLLPSFFKTSGLNQCTPLAFIIDGVVTDKGETLFTTRTAADSLQAPRLISWSNLYSAVKSYQVYQPMKLWTLNAID